MNKWFVDTETIGFHGVAVTIQWAIGDGEVHLQHIWKEPIGDTMRLIEDIVDGCVICHNLRFDWFHLSKIYNMFRSAYDQGWLCYSQKPLDGFDASFWAEMEFQSQFGPCLKPVAAVDTLILASKGENQSFLMNAKPVYIRRVPIGLAEPLRAIIESKTDLPWILFAKRQDPLAPKWSIVDCKNIDGDIDKNFRDLKLSFRPSKSLKHLAAYLCNHNVEFKFEDIGHATHPAEEGFAPFAKLLSSEEEGWLYKVKNTGKKGYSMKPTWPALLEEHIDHWYNDKNAKTYAADDITMLRKLYNKFGAPDHDEDALLACQISSVRLHGFELDLDGVKREYEISKEIVDTAKINVNSWKQVLGFVAEGLDSMEQFILANGCDQKVIDEIKNEYTLPEPEECCCQDEDFDADSVCIIDGVCQRCEGVGTVGPASGEACQDCNGEKKIDGKQCKGCYGIGLKDCKMPVVRRVEHVELVRRHKKRLELYDKLLLAKKAYPDFNAVGTKSGRLSGAGGLNWQGVDHSLTVRSLVTLAGEGEVLSAGDYSSQEVAIAATTMNDDDLMRDMKSGKSLHAIFASKLFKTTYEDIMHTYKTYGDERYGKGKSGVFLILYGGTYETLSRNCGVTLKDAEDAYNEFVREYPDVGKARAGITKRFSSIKSDKDGKMVYNMPSNPYIESVFGFRRYFHTEYKIQKMLWDLAQNLPKEWQRLTLKVQRDRKRPDRVQTVCGAVSSALYGSCYSIQNQIIRAANNHVIQSTARALTVGMQLAVWSEQPQGIHEFVLWLMSIHDELATVSKEEAVPGIKEKVKQKVEEQCEKIPLTSIEWFTGNRSWAEKGFGAEGEIFGWRN